MLKILKGQEDSIKGVIVCEESGNASSYPFILHFLSSATSLNQKAVIVSSRFTETNYKLVCSKAGIRWNPSQISFMEVLDAHESFNTTAKELMDRFQKKIEESTASVVLFDDLSILEHLGATPAEIAVFVHQIYSLLRRNSPDAQIVASFPTASKTTSLLQNRCHVFIQLTQVGHGFAKDASSKAVLTLNPSGARKGILLSGERAINGSWVSL